jgi:hypothetical protein
MSVDSPIIKPDEAETRRILEHNFERDHAESKRHAQAQWWEFIYRHFMPDLARMWIEEDRHRQLHGVDRNIELLSSRVQFCEEKVRMKVYLDILLEFWSSYEHRIRGWVARDTQLTDFLLYVFLPIRTVYLLPFQPLRRAWREHRNEWTEKYGLIKSTNIHPDGSFSHTTVSCAVPIEVLSATIGVQKFCWTTILPTEKVLSFYNPDGSITPENLNQLCALVRATRLTNRID